MRHFGKLGLEIAATRYLPGASLQDIVSHHEALQQAFHESGFGHLFEDVQALQTFLRAAQ